MFIERTTTSTNRRTWFLQSSFTRCCRLWILYNNNISSSSHKTFITSILVMLETARHMNSYSRTPALLWWFDWHHRHVPGLWESGGIPHFFATSVPPYRQCLTGSSWQQHSLTHWLWLAPLYLTRSVTRPVTLGHFLVKFGKNSIKLKIGKDDLKTILKKY